MEKVTDTLETLILMALDANHEEQQYGRLPRYRTELAKVEYDQGTQLPFDVMLPNSAFTFDFLTGEREYAKSKDELITHPCEVLGDECEVLHLCEDGTLMWRGFRRTTRPARVSVAGKAAHWYEMHVRKIAQSGAGKYTKRVVPLDGRGNPLFAKVQAFTACDPNRDGVALIVAASAVEDALRTGTMLAAVKDATEIKFPVPVDDYKDVFADREGPMNGARRKAIIHWVVKHLRRSTRGKEYEVKRHTRGVQEFIVDGLRIRLTPNGEIK